MRRLWRADWHSSLLLAALVPALELKKYYFVDDTANARRRGDACTISSERDKVEVVRLKPGVVEVARLKLAPTQVT